MIDIDNKENFKKASELIFELDTDIQEQLIELSIFSKLKDKGDKFKNIRELCLKIFNPNIIEFNDMYISIHLIDESKYRYILKSSKNIDDWDYINDDIIERLKEKEKEKEIQTKNIEENKFGYYGFISLDQKFKIKQTEQSMLYEKGETVMKEGKNVVDKRKIGKGAECLTMVPFKKIFDIILKINKNTDYFNIPETSRDDIDSNLIDDIKEIFLRKKLGYTKEDLDNYKDEDIKIIYYWYSNFSKSNICEEIRKFFEQNNILQYEK